MKLRNDKVEAALELASPVPSSFQQAVSWAGAAALQAADSGKLRQTMYFSAATGEKEVSGELGDALPFADALAKLLATSGALEGKVKVIFGDYGSCSMARSRWDAVPEGVDITYLPQQNMNTEVSIAGAKQLDDILDDASILLIVAAQQQELSALLTLFNTMSKKGRDVPAVLLNPRLITSTYVASGALLQQCRRFEAGLVATFHLEQIESEGGLSELNDAVLSRVWPRPFSVWEDNPDDPEAVDGYFLLDLNRAQAPSIPDVFELLKFSRKAFKRMSEGRKK